MTISQHRLKSFTCQPAHPALEEALPLLAAREAVMAWGAINMSAEDYAKAYVRYLMVRTGYNVEKIALAMKRSPKWVYDKVFNSSVTLYADEMVVMSQHMGIKDAPLIRAAREALKVQHEAELERKKAYHANDEQEIAQID